jgi:hypothetical protein
LGTFGDGSPAVLRQQVGTGTAVFAAFHPGLAYFHPALPRLPVGLGFNSIVISKIEPTNFSVNLAYSG